MTKEDIIKLQKLQIEIDEVVKSVDLLLSYDLSINFPKKSQWSTLPIEKIPELKDDLK